MSKIKKSFLIVGSFVCLIGCAEFSPISIGISPDEWNQYDPAKQAAIMQNHDYLAAMPQQIPNTIHKYCLDTKISEGKVMFPPFVESYGYQPAVAKIAQGSCQYLNFKSQDSTRSVDVKACYINNVLWLDASQYDLSKKYGTARIYYSSLWENGFTYKKINTSGYARLKDVNVELKQLPISACKNTDII